MFNKKKKDVEEFETRPSCNEEEITELDDHHCIEEMRDMMVNDLCPIIFNDEQNLQTSTQFAEVLFANNNLNAIKVDLENFPYRYLNGLQFSSVSLFIETITNRIKEESLLSVLTTMDLLDKTTNSFYLKYFNLRETIEQKMRGQNIIDDIIRNYKISNPYNMNEISDTEINNTKDFCNMIISFLFTAVMSVVFDAINCAVDDTIMRVHLIPNIMELKRDIISLYNPPKDDIESERFWLYADCTVKNTIISTIRYYSAESILTNISNIIITAHETAFYIYKDAIDQKYNKEDLDL